MKIRKSMLLGAILGSALIGTAHADSTVTLYGLIDTGLYYQTGKVGQNDVNRGQNGSSYKSSIGMGSGQESESRFGLRGTEDLGGGLQANFVLESGFSSTDGTRNESDRLFGRRATVGLSDDTWGSIDLGRTYNLASDWFGDIDPFGTDFMQSSMGTAFSAANTVRYDNMVLYKTPVMGGFQFGVGYAFKFDDVDRETNFQTKDNNRALTVGARYTSGPLEIVGSYDRQYLYPSQPAPQQFIIGAAYDFQVAKLALAYGRTRDGVLSGQEYSLVGGAFNNNTAAKGEGDTNDAFTSRGLKIGSYLVGLTVPVSSTTSVFGSWQYADANQGLSNTSVYSIGSTYNLSKRTNLYAVASYGRDVAYVNGDRVATVGVGLRHAF